MLITCNTSGECDVRHVMCQVVRRDNSVVEFDRVEICLFFFFFFLFYSFIPFTETMNRRRNNLAHMFATVKLEILNTDEMKSSGDYRAQHNDLIIIVSDKAIVHPRKHSLCLSAWIWVKLLYFIRPESDSVPFTA